MKSFRLSAQAVYDLDEIWLFIAQDNPEAADTFHDFLLSRILTLAGQPQLGRSREELGPGIRSFPIGGYVIFYRDSAKALEVVRILHGARDIENLF